jgi:hypothetical protein
LQVRWIDAALIRGSVMKVNEYRHLTTESVLDLVYACFYLMEHLGLVFTCISTNSSGPKKLYCGKRQLPDSGEERDLMLRSMQILSLSTATYYAHTVAVLASSLPGFVAAMPNDPICTHTLSMNHATFE